MLRTTLLAVALPLLLVGCRPDDQKTRSADPRAVAERLGPGLMARLDSANSAFRGEDYETAEALYRSIAAAAPNESVGWFGLYMTHDRTGDLAAADSALDRARRASPGASLLRPEGWVDPATGDTLEPDGGVP